MDDDTSYQMAVPFLDGHPSFAAGVRLGMLYSFVSRLSPRKRKYADMISEKDEEQVRLMMGRLGWGVSRRERCESCPEWIIITFRRRRTEKLESV